MNSWETEVDKSKRVERAHYRTVRGIWADDPAPLVPGGELCVRVRVGVGGGGECMWACVHACGCVWVGGSACTRDCARVCERVWVWGECM